MISLYVRYKPKRFFIFCGKRYEYARHAYNNTWRSERAIEIPIAFAEISRTGAKRILEVGNVLQNYYRCSHDILDKYEKAPRVINTDILDFMPDQKYDLIVSISTMEHVGWDEEKKQPEKVLQCLKNLIENCLTPRGRLLVTMPLGYNRYVDGYLRDGDYPFSDIFFMKRISAKNEWIQVPYEEVRDTIYGHPFFFGNAIMVGLFCLNQET